MDKNKGVLLIFLTALVSGFSIFINKFAVSGLNPYIFTFAKNVLVAVFVISLILFFKEFNNFKKLNKQSWLKLILIGLFGGSIPFLLFFKGLQLTIAGKAAFIHKTMFVYVIILAFFFLKEKIKKSLIIAAILLLLGNALMLNFFSSFNLGDLLIVIATLFWAVENIISKHALKELNSKLVIFGRMFFGSLFIIFFLLITKQFSLISTLSIPQLSWVLLTSILLLLYVMTWYTGLKYIKVSVASCILLLGTFITTLLNYLFLNTTLTLSQAIGMFLLLVGVIVTIGFSQIHNTVKDIIKWSKKWIHLT